MPPGLLEDGILVVSIRGSPFTGSGKSFTPFSRTHSANLRAADCCLGLRLPLNAPGGSSALHAVGDTYLLLTRPSPQFNTLELRFQFRYAASQPPRLLQLDPHSLWFSPASSVPAAAPVRHKVEPEDVQKVLTDRGAPLRYNELRQQIMHRAECSKRTADLAIRRALQEGFIVHDNAQYRLPF